LSGVRKREADGLLAAGKFVEEGADLRWHDVVLPSGFVVRRELRTFVVTVRGRKEHLLASGLRRADDDVQLFLQAPRGRKESTIARLCLTPAHGNDLHWHYDHRTAPDNRESVSHPPETMTPEALLDEVFLPGLSIARQTGLDL
jgi:hypothetical protein